MRKLLGTDCVRCRFIRKTEVRANFLNPFTDCSSCKGKFVVCPVGDEETNGSYPFAVLNRLVHLCTRIYVCEPGSHIPPPGKLYFSPFYFFLFCISFTLVNQFSLYLSFFNFPTFLLPFFKFFYSSNIDLNYPPPTRGGGVFSIIHI
jgi:hypothetical protein